MRVSCTYISTRGRLTPVGFEASVLMGLATDGGLLLPKSIPAVGDRLDRWRGLSYPDLAVELMSLFANGEIPDDVLHSLVARSYATFDHPDVVTVKPVGPLHVLELFHGPTLAFKDVALQLLGNLFEHTLARTGERLNIVGATSGDTGSAAICGVRGKANIHIFIMFPYGRVSPLQERQMTTVPDANVHCIAVRGTFDDGQRVLKEIFNDVPFKAAFRLGAVNSVNWARVLAQIVYHFYGVFRVMDRTGCRQVQVCVPTGNFGDIFAGYLARRMGAPISRLILATNENDILTRFFTTGVDLRGDVRVTTSPSMDIQAASNFERYLYYRVGEDSVEVCRLMEELSRTGAIRLPGSDDAFVAGTGTVSEVSRTIRRYYEGYGYVLDPHSAVGAVVAERFLRPDEPVLSLATAHPAKFGETIAEALGQNPVRHPRLEALTGLPTRCVVLPAERDSIAGYIRETLASAP